MITNLVMIELNSSKSSTINFLKPLIIHTNSYNTVHMSLPPPALCFVSLHC